MTKPSCKCWQMEWREIFRDYVFVSMENGQEWGKPPDDWKINPWTGKNVNHDNPWQYCPYCNKEAIK